MKRRQRFGTTALAVGLLSFLLASFFVTTQATAQSSGNPCIKEEVGGDPPCTANDVRFAALDLLSGPAGCKLGDTINVTVLATLESGPERFDVGIWINENGGSALSDPDGTCYRDFLDPVSSDNSDCNQDGGPYYNGPGEDDSCGDVPAVGSDPCGSLTGPCSDGSGGTCLFTFRTVTFDLVCADGNGDGYADTGWATSWDNNADYDCFDELDTNPGTGSKCFSYDFANLNGMQIYCSGVDPETECCDPATGDITPIDDGVACTDDVCDPDTGIVTHTPDDGYCDDGLFCNGAETCDPSLDCQPGTDPCDPELFCDEEADACVGCLTPADCDDGVACTVDTCEAGSCVNTPDDGYCDDGLFCNGAEFCDPISDCQAGTDPCDDGNDCTDDSCDEPGQSCEHSCNATGSEDPCCEVEPCLSDPVCEVPVCGDGIIEYPEQCDPPGWDPSGCEPGSEFCNASCACSPVAIELSYLTATGEDAAIRIDWETESEIDNAGFNILRSETVDGEYEQINPALIPAEGGPTSGAQYQYLDTNVVSGTMYWYKLEDMDIYGVRTLHGPVSAMPSSSEYSGVANAEASAYGAGSLVGSGVSNELALILVPIGAVVLMRIRRRKR